MIREQLRTAHDGLLVLPFVLAGHVGAIWLVVHGARTGPWPLIGSIVVLLAVFIQLFGFFMVAPNEGKVLQLFGDYKGTVRKPGLRWANPFYSKHRVSLRVRNFDSAKLKVNDQSGNPIEIAAVVVWRVVDTAEAVFQVDDYENFVHVQTESWDPLESTCRHASLSIL